MTSTKTSKSLHISHNQHILCVYLRVWGELLRDIVWSFKTLQLHNLWEMVKTTIKLCKRFFSHKINNYNKSMQRKPGMNCFAHSRVWRHSHQIQNCNFVTSWELIKILQDFAQSRFSIKLIKLCHKSSDEFQFPLKHD